MISARSALLGGGSTHETPMGVPPAERALAVEKGPVDALAGRRDFGRLDEVSLAWAKENAHSQKSLEGCLVWKNVWAFQILVSSFSEGKLRDLYSWCLTLCTAMSDGSHSLLSKNACNCYDLAQYRKTFLFLLFMICLNFYTIFATMNSEYKSGHGPVKHSIYSHLENFITKHLLLA